MGGTTRISDEVVGTLTLQSSAYGLVVPIVGGVFKVGGNLVDYLDFTSIAQTEEQGGKGGGVESTTYTYTVSIIMGLCMGRVNVGRVFKGKAVLGSELGSASRQTGTQTIPGSGAMVLTLPNGPAMLGDAFVTYSSGDKLAVLSSGADYKVEGSSLTILDDKWRGKSLSYGFSYSSATPAGLTEIGLSLKSGNLTQTAPSWIATSGDPSHSQNYPGLAYVHGEDYALGNSPSVENHSFEVAGFGAYRYGAGKPDCNTAEFIAWVLSAADFGAGVPAERLDVKAWIDYVAAAGLLSSPALTTATKAADLLKRACDLTNTVAVPSYDRIKLLPLCDVEITGNGVTYTPDNTVRFDVNADWIIGDVELNRKQKSDRFNHFRVEYKDRGSQYAPAIAEAMDDEDIAINGKRTADTISAPWVCSAEVARLIAQIALQRSMNVNATGRVVLPFAFCMLEPGDLITITEPRRGLDRLPVRVTGTSDNGRRVTVEFEEWPLGVASPAQYEQEVPAGFLHDYSAAPGNVDAPVIFEGPALFASPTGLEVFVAVRGSSPVWGGAHVYVSYDGTQYRQIGTVYGGSRYGSINGAVSAGAVSFAVDGLAGGQLLSGSYADAQNLETLCYIGGADPEFVAYESATLTGSGAYTLGGVVRAAYSPASAHADNVPFVRMDSVLARSGALDVGLIGQTIYIKCLSFNIYQRAAQSLADATAYTYTITGKAASYLPGIAGKALSVTADAFNFTLPKSGGAITPSAITLTATRKGGLEGGAVSWSVVSGTATLTGSGDTVTLLSSNLGTPNAKIRATVTDSVGSYSGDVTISKVREGEDGLPGSPGYNTATVTIYKRGATAPSGPASTVTYTFATTALTGLDSGWSTSWPAGTDPVWARVVSFSGTGATDTAAAGEWTAPQIVAQNGSTGSNGLNVATVYLYQRTSSASAPALPNADVTYTFASGAISGLSNGWLASLPATGGSYRWVTQATAASASATDTLPPSEWAAAGLIAQDGSDGASALTFELSSESVTLPATSAGVVTSYAGASTTITAKRGSDVESGWSYSKADSSGLTTSLSGNVVTVTALANGTNSAYVDITPSRDGYPAQPAKRFNVTKNLDAPGASGPVQFSASASSIGSGTRYVAIKMTTTGEIYRRTSTGGAWVKAGDWYTPNGSAASAFYIYPAYTMGSDIATGPADAWYQMTSDREWSGASETNATLIITVATAADLASQVAAGQLRLYAINTDN